MDPPLQAGVFVTTRWTRVVRARGQAPEAQAALGELCEAYWTPVFRFLCREGRDEDAARELTQEFFARLLARQGLDNVEPGRGRFRSFLLGAVKHFLADQRDHALAAKRGGGRRHVPLQGGAGEGTTEVAIPDPASQVPDTYFDREWALTLVERAVTTLAEEMRAGGKAEQFEALKPWLLGEVTSLSQADTARHLGMTEGAVKVAVHRLRKRFRELVKAEIAHTLADPAQEQEELNYLIEVLARA